MGNRRAPQPGVLTVAADGDVTLELIGGFDFSVRTATDDGEIIGLGEQTTPIVQGLCAGVKVTLVDVVTTRIEGMQFGHGTSNFHRLAARRALVGMHLDDVSAPVFSSATFRYENLLVWLNTHGLEQKVTGDGDVATARIVKTEPRVAHVEGWTVEATLWSSGFHFETRRDTASLVGETQPYIDVTAPSPVSYLGFDDMSKALMDLLTLASGEACGVITSSLASTETREIRTGPNPDDSTAVPITAEVYGQYVHKSRPDDKPQNAHRFLFTCAAKPFSELISQWIPLRAKAIAGCNVLFGLLYARPGFTETRLLSTAVASEAIHRDLFGSATPIDPFHFKSLKQTMLDTISDNSERDWVNARLHNNPSYLDRLLDLAERPSQPAVNEIIPDRAKWARSLRDARNGLAHNANGSAGTVDIFALTETTIFLLYLVLMKELGLSDEIQLKAAQDNELLASLRDRSS